MSALNTNVAKAFIKFRMVLRAILSPEKGLTKSFYGAVSMHTCNLGHVRPHNWYQLLFSESWKFRTYFFAHKTPIYTMTNISESASTVAHCRSPHCHSCHWLAGRKPTMIQLARTKDQGQFLRTVWKTFTQSDESNSSGNSSWNYLSFLGLPITCPKSPLHGFLQMHGVRI